MARIPAPAEVATRLDIDEGSDVVVRRLTFWLEDMPGALHDGCFPAELAAGTAIEQPHKIRGGAHVIIEDPEGPIRRRIARSVDEISGRMPTPGEVRELGLPPGVPVFRVLRMVYDTEGRRSRCRTQLPLPAGISSGTRLRWDEGVSGHLRIGACLSLSGRFAQFGRQAARGLETWLSLDGAADILVEDDCSDRRTLESVLLGVAARCDILLGPYSTQLMRTAGRMAAEAGWLDLEPRRFR